MLTITEKINAVFIIEFIKQSDLVVSSLSACVMEIKNNDYTTNTQAWDIMETFSTLTGPGLEPGTSEIAIPWLTRSSMLVFLVVTINSNIH